jgi:hypothetical protein
MQELTPTPIAGNTPARDPEFGVVYRIVQEYETVREEIEEEVHHDGIELVADPPQVFLTLRRGKRTTRVASLCMTGMHVDSRLVIMDPDYTGGATHGRGWTPW